MLWLLAAAAIAPVVERPNIILILSDDHARQAISAYGSRIIDTPGIDRLASEGFRFDRHYTANPICAPSRASLLTGKHSHANGHKDNVSTFDGTQQTFPKLLQQGGYETAAIGKWHLGSEPFSLPEHHGFDVNIAGNAHGAPGSYFFPYAGDWKIPATGQRAKWNVLPDGKPGEYLTDRLTDEAVRFIRECRGKPFFLYFPHYGVHTPLQAKREMTAGYERVPEAERQGKPEYAAMIESVDESVGRVMATLQELGRDKDTVILFTSDNGGFYGATRNAPLRANKGAYYEGGIRVPLIVKWPGVARPGLVVSEPVTSTDLYPTCLVAAGLPLRQNQHPDGVSLRPVLSGEGPLPPRPLFWHYPHYNEHPSSVPSSVVRKGEWKLIETFDPEGIELYNLASDLGETENLATAEPGRVKALRAELATWRASVGAEKMLPNPDYDPSARPAKKKKGASPE